MVKLDIKLFIIKLNDKTILAEQYKNLSDDIKILLESKYLSDNDIKEICKCLYNYTEERTQEEINYVREQETWILEGQVWQFIFPFLSNYYMNISTKTLEIE